MRGLLILVSLSLVAAGCASRHSAPLTSTPQATWSLDPATRVEAWRADIDFLVRELPRRHVKPFFHCDRAHFESAATELSRGVEDQTDAEVLVGMMRLVALLGDAHTSVDVFGAQPRLRRFALDLYDFDDGVAIVAARESQQELIGQRLVRFGEVSADEALERAGQVWPSENPSSFRHLAPRHMLYAEIAHALRLIQSCDRASIVVQDPRTGREQSAEITPLADGEPLTGPPPPASGLVLSRQPRPLANWFESVPEHDAIYFRYGQCADLPDLPVSKLCQDLLKAIDDEAPKRLIVDLRSNGGGDSGLLAPLFRGLRLRFRIGVDCKLAVLIGRRTFSSAQMNAVELKRSLGATLIGEPTGQKPNAYGEVRRFRLPRTGLWVNYSTRFFRTAEDDPPSTEPDLRVRVLSDDFFAGRDAAYEAALVLE